MEKKNLSGSLRSLEKKIIKNNNQIFVILVSALFVIFLLNSFFTINSTYILNKKISEINEFNKPVNISLSVINCNDCSNISSIIESIKSENVNILKENSLNSNSDDAKKLISKYNIQKLPSIIITGEINNNKTKFNNFKKTSDALVLDKVNAPYFDVALKEIKGKVDIMEVIDSSCKDCVSLSSIPLNFGKVGVLISNWKKFEYNSEKGKNLISKFGIKEVPTLLISTDINYYGDIKKGLDKLNLKEKQGFYMLHATQPPYRNLSENKIVGLVDLIMLTDKSCPTCYNVTLNKRILQGLGVVIKTENTYDVSSSKGKELISKYNIQKVPAIILSPEAKMYDSFVNAWKSVGSEESDGWFVMKKPEPLGVVKDIVNNKVIGTKK